MPEGKAMSTVSLASNLDRKAIPTTGRHLILGGTGFIGRHVALLMLRDGHEVVLTHRGEIQVEFPSQYRNAITWVPLDIARADWARVLDGIDIVHHYAWSSIPATANADPEADLTGNVAPTLRLLEAARKQIKPPRIVFASSGGTVYGRVRKLPVPEDHPLAPITAYGVGKATVELYMGCYRTLHGLDCRIGRIANPFGAGQNTQRGQGAVTAFLQAALAERPIEIWGNGEAIRDYIHIADAAAGLVRLALAPSTNSPMIYNIGSGHGISLNGIVAELELSLGRHLYVQRLPGRAFDVPVSVLDVTLGLEQLQWAANLSFPEGVGRALQDLRRKASFSTL
jgi:UDP-glucose 4-epimerase